MPPKEVPLLDEESIVQSPEPRAAELHSKQYNVQVVMVSHSQADSFRARHLASKLLPSVVCRKVVSSRYRRHSARMGEYVVRSANTYNNTHDQRT